MKDIPRTSFSTDLIPEAERFEIWRDSISVLYETTRPHSGTDQAFSAQLDACMIDQLFLAPLSSQALTFERLPKSIKRDGLDMIFLQLRVKGQSQFTIGKKTIFSKAGDIGMSDLSQPSHFTTSNSEVITVIIPRDLAEEFIPDVGRYHGHIFPRGEPMTQLLRSHLLTLFEISTKITPESCPGVQRSLLEVMAAALKPSSHNISNNSEPISTSVLLEIKKFIRKNLADSELSPNSISSRFKISRAQLYRIAKPLGGLTHYIRITRLKRCFLELQSPSLRHISITQMGFKWGFNDSGTFTRNFKRHFGITPKEAREIDVIPKLNQKKSTSNKSEVDKNFVAWIRSLSM